MIKDNERCPRCNGEIKYVTGNYYSSSAKPTDFDGRCMTTDFFVTKSSQILTCWLILMPKRRW